MIGYHCAKFGDFGFSRFGFIVQTDRHTHTHTHRQTESQTRMIAIRDATTVGAVIIITYAIYVEKWAF